MNRYAYQVESRFKPVQDLGRGYLGRGEGYLEGPPIPMHQGSRAGQGDAREVGFEGLTPREFSAPV